VIADNRHMFAIPEGVGYEEAAALPTGLLTEHGALMLGEFQPGQTVLITGATSSIGLIGVQIAKALDANCVIATSRTAAKAALLKEAGADVVIALTEATLKATSEQGADVVLDHVCRQTLASCLTATQVGGRIINIGRLDRAESTINLNTLSARQLRLRGVSFNFSQADESSAGSSPPPPNTYPQWPTAASVPSSTPCSPSTRRRKPRHDPGSCIKRRAPDWPGCGNVGTCA
jgi:NADPH:quinone reductase